MESAPGVFLYPQILCNPADNLEQGKRFAHYTTDYRIKITDSGDQQVTDEPQTACQRKDRLPDKIRNFLGSSAWHVIKC